MLPLPPLAYLPPAKTGFTLSFWLRLGAQPADDPEVSSHISPLYLPYISQPADDPEVSSHISPLYLPYISQPSPLHLAARRRSRGEP